MAMQMKMASMKMPKKSAKEMKGMEVAPSSTQDEYPYGLRVSLGNHELGKMGGMEGCQVGDEMIMMARCTIVSKSENEQQGGKADKRMELQIKSMGMKPMKAGKSDSDGDWYQKRKKG